MLDFYEQLFFKSNHYILIALGIVQGTPTEKPRLRTASVGRPERSHTYASTYVKTPVDRKASADKFAKEKNWCSELVLFFLNPAWHRNTKK